MAQWSSLFQVRALAITFSFITAAADIRARGAAVKILTQVMEREQHLSMWYNVLELFNNPRTFVYLGEADLDLELIYDSLWQLAADQLW